MVFEWVSVATPPAAYGFEDPCLARSVRALCFQDGQDLIPNLSHHVTFGGHEIRNYTFLAILSSVRFLQSVCGVFQPCMVMIHADVLPVGSFWDTLVRLIPHLIHVQRSAPSVIFGHPVKVIEHSSDIARIEAVKKFGGVYQDTDYILLNPVEDLRNYSVVMGKTIPNVNYCNCIFMGKPAAEFLNVWHGRNADQSVRYTSEGGGACEYKNETDLTQQFAPPSYKDVVSPQGGGGSPYGHRHRHRHCDPPPAYSTVAAALVHHEDGNVSSEEEVNHSRRPASLWSHPAPPPHSHHLHPPRSQRQHPSTRPDEGRKGVREGEEEEEQRVGVRGEEDEEDVRMHGTWPSDTDEEEEVRAKGEASTAAARRGAAGGPPLPKASVKPEKTTGPQTLKTKPRSVPSQPQHQLVNRTTPQPPSPTASVPQATGPALPRALWTWPAERAVAVRWSARRRASWLAAASGTPEQSPTLRTAAAVIRTAPPSTLHLRHAPRQQTTLTTSSVPTLPSGLLPWPMKKTLWT
ncbi:uncharacterized protein LOC143285271 [Babylonia areolata]|uniref:uncharacterized protein LOC143285271 n=1 Tax=Babylonia areolata TaxID=304850 RepID=UPI003FD54683